MSDTLARIVVYKREHVAACKARRPLAAIEVDARAAKDGPYEEPQLQAITAKRGLWAADIILPRDWEAARRKALDHSDKD